MKTYNFHLHGEKGIYQIAFAVDNDNIESNCDCHYQTGHKLCWHRYYILAGKTQRILEEEYSEQKELTATLQKTVGGRELINQAKATFGEKETCRRCNSSNILELNQGIAGKIIKIFIPSGQRYFCWKCRWSW
ncbi:MAG TPA: hypothetical protein PL009_06220 [Flavipsychrobacter sp.]|nr:hypothetical protein [Flavipsychrobacter sp.]